MGWSAARRWRASALQLMQGKQQGLQTLSRVLLGAWAGACMRRGLLWRGPALSRGGRTYRRGSSA